MLIRMDDLIDSRTSHFVSWLENIRCCPRNYLAQQEPPPEVPGADREE